MIITYAQTIYSKTDILAQVSCMGQDIYCRHRLTSINCFPQLIVGGGKFSTSVPENKNTCNCFMPITCLGKKYKLKIAL